MHSRRYKPDRASVKCRGLTPVLVRWHLVARLISVAALAVGGFASAGRAADEPKKPVAISIGERQKSYKQGLYGVGVFRPRTAEDLTAIGLKSPATPPELVVFAQEHPSLPPPRLMVQTFRTEPVLVLSWLEHDLTKGPLAEVADITYAWPVQGTAVRLLLVRTVKNESALEAPLAEVNGSEAPARSIVLKATDGPSVILEPSYIIHGVKSFFARYGQVTPEGLKDPLILAAIRPTASGRSGRALGAAALKGGGTRVRLAVPIDAGLPAWGPRVSDRVDVFVIAPSKGPCEWLIELDGR